MLKIIIFLSGILMFSGCSTHSESVQTTKQSSVVYSKSKGICKIDNQSAPSWICGESIYPDYITAVGMSSRGESFKRKKSNSTIRGVENLFSKIKSDVKMRSIEYFLRLGTSPDDYKNYPVLVGQYVSKKTLSKVDQLDSWKRDKTGIVYTLVGVSKKTISKHSFDFLSGGNKDNEEVIKAFGLSFDLYFKKR